MADSPSDTPDTETLDAGTADRGASDTSTAEILERVREDRLATAVEELIAEDEGRAEAREDHQEALRAEYQAATRPTPQDLEQPPLVENPPPEGPLIGNAPPEGLLETQPAIHEKAAAMGTVALEGLDAVLANKTGVPEVAGTLIRTVVNALDARSADGIRAQAATLMSFLAVDLAAAAADVPGSDPNTAEQIKSAKERIQAEIENRLGEPPADEEGTAGR